MKTAHCIAIILLATTVAACPVRPKDEEGDDGAQGETTGPAPAKPVETQGDPEPETSSSDTGSSELICEDELASVKAQLAKVETELETCLESK